MKCRRCWKNGAKHYYMRNQTEGYNWNDLYLCEECADELNFVINKFMKFEIELKKTYVIKNIKR